ncbi:uncharacterized protein PgNI_01595 [Pyricularia grisea]|uniref:Secreted protein n=1 Tax=Pyricularia grisea TaxID=148305 RepID=A0A6P8BJX5_PYRGI|nr:uncharacterized protein PgNI_01595 [Pyricularia grisea]TLD16975.1 hypothetical protein PgNI_01595 [Pyricularia grisea]
MHLYLDCALVNVALVLTGIVDRSYVDAHLGSPRGHLYHRKSHSGVHPREEAYALKSVLNLALRTLSRYLGTCFGLT